MSPEMVAWANDAQLITTAPSVHRTNRRVIDFTLGDPQELTRLFVRQAIFKSGPVFEIWDNTHHLAEILNY